MNAKQDMTDLSEEAADWFIRVRAARVSAEDYSAWLRWIEADPKHRAAFDGIQAAWDTVGKIQAPPWPKPEELSRKAPYKTLGMALAAGVLVVIAGGLWLLRTDLASQRITTQRGETQSAVLPDGSHIELGGATGVRLKFTPRQRLVTAEEGEVFYKVQRDTRRPFVVEAGPVSVTAVGTAFAVRREGEAVSVVVTEGVVDVRAAEGRMRAAAGQRVRFDRGRLITASSPVRAAAASAWRRGQLRFEEEPLRVVVASLNRYAKRPIVIADPHIAELKFTGTVFDDRAEDWVKAAARVFPVAVDDASPERVIIKARE